MQICNFSEGFATHILPALCLQVFVTDQLKILVLQNVLFSINLEKLGWSLRVYEKKIKIFQDFTILSYFFKIGNSKKNPFPDLSRTLPEKTQIYQDRMHDLNATFVLWKCLFWASGDNLGLKCPANSCKQVAYVAGVQENPKSCRALKVAKGLKIWLK